MKKRYLTLILGLLLVFCTLLFSACRWNEETSTETGTDAPESSQDTAAESDSVTESTAESDTEFQSESQTESIMESESESVSQPGYSGYVLTNDRVYEYDNGEKTDRVITNTYVTINNKTYYVVNNTIVKNYYLVGDKVVDFGSDGVKTDKVLNNTYVTINNNTYYVVNNTIVKNYYLVGDKVVDFGSDGVKTDRKRRCQDGQGHQ